MPSESSHFVIAGTGYTGLRVLNALPADRSLGMSRTPASSSGGEILALDLDLSSARKIDLPSPCTLLYSIPPGTDAQEDPRLESFLASIQPAPVRLVYLSTSGVYGDRAGKLTRETDPVNPSTDRAIRRLAAEQLLQRWCMQADCELFVLRIPGIYGPGRLGLERLQNGATIIREVDSGPGDRIHVDDLVICCIAAMTAEAPPGIYNTADGDHRSNYWFRRTVAEFAGLPAPQEISFEEAEGTWSETRLSFVRESRRLDTEKLRSVLKVNLRYTNAEDGIRASLAEEVL